MGLLSLFQRKTSPHEPAAAALQAGDEVQRARTRARRRLIGAAVLVGIGIVGFPLLFETHPRPIPVDIPIEIANKDKVAPLAMPPLRPGAASTPTPAAATERRASAPGAGVITESASAAGREVAAPAPAPAAVAATKESASVVEPPARKVEAPPAATPAKAATASTASDGARERALEGKAVAAKDEPNASSDARFVVQVGAFAEAATARETRLRVEKLGLKTYTQVVETAAGNRIRVRVGPFVSRDEADRAAGKLKSAGLPAALLTL